MNYFKGKCGEDFVNDHKYNVSIKDEKSLDLANNWSLVIKKGMVLVMSMIVERVALDKGRAWAQRNTCPHCYKTDLGVMADEGWLHW